MDIKEFLVDEDCTILEAMALLEKVAKKVLFVTQEGRFVAALTDGDIRRWILKKGNLEAQIKHVANYSPKYLKEGEECSAREYMKKNAIEAVPIMNHQHEIISIVFWTDEIAKPKPDLQVPVVIMAGGVGTRLSPYTKVLPKPLIPIGEIPIVEHIINRFIQYGIRQFFMVVHHKKNMIKAYFNEVDKDYEVTYAVENTPLGTGGGLSLLKGQVHSTFFLSNCDILILEDYEKILKYHRYEKNLITMVSSLKNITIPYGVIEISESGEIEKMIEKPHLNFFINTGMYVVEPSVIEELQDDRAIDFPGIIENYRNAGERIGVYPVSENNWLDMGQLDEMERMKMRLGCE
ncbi:MAG: sugar phosphate nucleotidyltransferase [Bacillota bacterium]|nr:sugar phosphate nucleotidyltransferase [Bacillota bacterium]